ncbi:MAG: SAP domain-containing protein [Syntrophorhabdus aromaticivorans]|uniref:SAP domain-containing protein n=1 Tax=Syntrophorhabdus aromaticivorans TaxID=328301 RepID=A0A971M269_9BACT|nr:SAP domain-containing protein [Syntrophorhabdus aromaticivorans]
MAYKFKASDLKSLLKESGLKVSGRKEELIQRLIDNNAKAMSEATQDIEVYKCTTAGMQLAQNYLDAEKEKKTAAEQEVLNLLIREECAEAVRAVIQYEASQVFPRGIGIDWKSYDGTSDVEALKIILNSIPTILQHVDGDRLKQLCLAAGMMHLWCTNTARHWLPEGFNTGIHLDGDAACRMFVFYASHLRDMNSYRQAGARTVEVLCVDDSCSECRKISGKKYLLENVPELPYVKCTDENGCRCTTVVREFK